MQENWTDSGGNALGIDFSNNDFLYSNETSTKPKKSSGIYWDGTKFVTPSATASTATGANKWDQGGAMNPYTRISNVKSQPIQTKLDKILEDFDKFRTDNASTVTGIATDTATARSNMRSNNDQEGAAIGNFYNGGVQSQLNTIMAKKQAALDNIAKRLSLESQGAINRRMAAGGTTGSAYLDRIKANAMAKIYDDEANQMSDQEIKNLQWLSGMQAALSGKRQQNETDWAKLGTLPLTSNIMSNEALINALNGITNIDAKNNDYGLSRYFNPLTDSTPIPYYPPKPSGGNPGLDELMGKIGELIGKLPTGNGDGGMGPSRDLTPGIPIPAIDPVYSKDLPPLSTPQPGTTPGYYDDRYFAPGTYY